MDHRRRQYVITVTSDCSTSVGRLSTNAAHPRLFSVHFRQSLPAHSRQSKSSRRKTKDSWSFPPITFVSRPLTPPYVPFGIRRFLTLCAIERNSPLGKGSQHGEVYRSPQHGALCLPHWPNILCYCSHRFAPSMA